MRYLIAGLVLLSVFILPAGNSEAVDLEEAKNLYQAHCSSCHGGKGKPDPDNPMFVQLGILPANFTDALFSSREPASDFFLVIKYGGAAKGFSEIMPAFKETLNDDQIRSLVAYVKILAGDRGYPSGDMNFILPIRTKKAFPEDEVVWKYSFQNNAGDRDRDRLRNVIELEKRIFKRTQLSLEVRHSLDDGVDNGHGNIDQVEPGIKTVMYINNAQQFILAAGVLIAIKTEEHDASDEFIPYLAAGKGLTDTLTLQGTARANLPTDRFAGGDFELSGVMHWQPSMWPRTIKPGLELVASFPFERGDTDSVHVSLIPQAQIGLNKRGQVMLNAGAEVPLNETDRYDYRAYIYLIWDFADGGLFSGW